MSRASFPAPPSGDRVEIVDGRWIIPDRPVIPCIEGDGIGPDIWSAARRVLDAAIDKAYGPSEEEATRTATDNACGFLASGMTESIRCQNTPPAKVECR